MLDINLKQLEVFVTTAEYGSFTRAADTLYLSQSTVSSHIRGLEDSLHTMLFYRSAKRKHWACFCLTAPPGAEWR